MNERLTSHIIYKLLSGRWLLAVMFGLTVCAGYLTGIMDTNAFIGIAGGVFTGYQMKKMEDKP